MGTLDIKHTNVFIRNFESLNDPSKRFIINVGGSRSSKTISLCQLMIVYCLTNEKKSVSIVRKSFPSLRASVMRDFFDVMKDLGLYNDKNHNKTEHTYTFDNGSFIEFFSVDNEQKLRGRKRNILWANEANEINHEEYTQLNMRTEDKLFFDFNPSDNYHWLYNLLENDESIKIHSTYKDNPFLPNTIVKQIEGLIEVDESYYKIYALGERSVGKTTIYTHWKYYDTDPETNDIIYGLDPGFNHPLALVEIRFVDDDVYVKELIYESNMTSNDLLQRLDSLNISKSIEMICDTARPEIIEDLRRKGYNAKNAIKDVKPGIDSIKSSKLFLYKESVNLIKEINTYKWKTKGDMILDEPVKIFDDGMDAMRYGVHYKKQQIKKNNKNSFRVYY